MKTIALIPARSGSKRIPDKNIRYLSGHPLIAYTISAALESKVFDRVVVSTDSRRYAKVAEKYGAYAPFLRPPAIAGDNSPDIEWVSHAMEFFADCDCFSILRPTSPFRMPKTIRRAWNQFRTWPDIDSLRAVEKCSQHPGKMWVLCGRRMTPLLPLGPPKQPWHSSQYPTLPVVYVQNASLEIAHRRVLTETNTIAGEVVAPFFTIGHEGIDLNTEYDWQVAEQMVKCGVRLPEIFKEGGI